MELTIIPKMSEKTVAQAQAGMYVFTVPATATKQEVSKAVTKQYGVKVLSVNTLTTEGKTKRTWRRGNSPVVGKRNDVKKAYVRLAEGDKITAFDLPDTKEAK